jgi:hypothetical protein
MIGNRLGYLSPVSLLDPDDIEIFASSHSNCLLIGPDPQVDDALTELTPYFRYPPAIVSVQPLLDLPSPSRAATFVFRNVGMLTASQQADVASWLESAPGRVQVVSTAPTPLWPAVQARSFLASLYYRLNTLTFPLVA